MRLQRASVVASLAIAAAAACSTFSSTDSPATADAGEDAPPPPAPPPPPTPIDAGADAAFCTGRDASFCWSFDEGANPLQGPLLALNPAETSKPELTDAALSPPNAMECTTRPVDGGGLRSCALDLARTASTHVRCDVAIYIAANDGGVFDPLVIVEQDFNGYGIGVGADGRASVTRAGFPVADIGNVPFETWTTIGLEVTIFATSTTGTGYVEGATNSHTDTYDGSAPILGNFIAAFGPTYAVGNWTVRYDNLVCNYE